jgi:signal transduction histidine kinase
LATISANLSFVREGVAGLDSELGEALHDVDEALSQLTHDLEQLEWIGRWLGGQAASLGRSGDARTSVEAAARPMGDAIELDLPDGPVLVARTGPPLTCLVELLLRNAIQHGRTGVQVRLSTDGVIEVQDHGRCVAEELRDRVFTMAGQQQIKGRSDGRYMRGAGLLAAHALAESLGAQLEADGEDGAAIFRVRLNPKA